MAVVKKSYIDNSILRELKEKYPPIENDNGVAYKQKLEYITFEIDFLSDPIIRGMRNRYGAVVIAIIFYLRTEMCKNGWKVRVDQGEYYNSLVQDCSYVCNVDMNQTNQIIHELVDKRIMYVVQDDAVEEGKWMTCIQQLYNFEMASNNRKSARERQARRRERQNHPQEDALKEQQGYQMPKKSADADILDDITNNEFLLEDNPFGI